MLIASAALVVLMACASVSQEGGGKYVPGTYRGKGEGLHGDILVETTFSPSRITRIAVISHQETSVVSTATVEKIPVEILAAQRSDVDAVTGATYTSDGIKSAVQSAIRQALRQ